MNTKIIIIRHAESEKNIKDIHGGKGECLTSFGKLQARELAERLCEIGVNNTNSIIVYPSNIQTKETAQILIDRLGITDYNISDFKPLYLGIVHGLSNNDVRSKYPEVFDMLVKWRKKEMEICDLTIPEMENPLEFYKRGLNVLRRIKIGKNNIFIATNSLYILLLNILLGNTCEKGGGYKHFDIPNCGISLFEKEDDGKIYLNKKNTDVRDVLEYK